MVPILLSTACYHSKYSTVLDSALRAINPFHDIDGLEVSMLTSNECLGFKPDPKILEFSKNKTVFLHAPSKDIIYSSSEKSNNVIFKLKSLYDKLSAKNIVFHLENIDSIGYLAGKFLGYSISVENPDLKIAKESYFDMMNECVNHGFSGFALDLEHAKSDLEKFLKNDMKDKVVEVHFSNHNPCFNHDCYSAVFERFERNISAIKKINKPVVVEVDLRSAKQLSDNYLENTRMVIRKEINLIRKNLE